MHNTVFPEVCSAGPQGTVRGRQGGNSEFMQRCAMDARMLVSVCILTVMQIPFRSAGPTKKIRDIERQTDTENQTGRQRKAKRQTKRQCQARRNRDLIVVIP